MSKVQKKVKSRTCGDFGGKNTRGVACTRLSGWGVKGQQLGNSNQRCKLHFNADQLLPATVTAALAALPENHRQFVMFYCGEARGQGLLAVKLAGYGKQRKSNDSSLISIACELLRRPPIRQAIHVWMQAFAVSAAELTHEFADLRLANLGPFVEIDKKGVLRIKKDMKEDEWLAHKHWIKSIKIDSLTGRVTELTLHDALAARRDLAKILKLYSDSMVFQLTIHQKSDEQLLQELNEARAALGRTAFLSKN